MEAIPQELAWLVQEHRLRAGAGHSGPKLGLEQWILCFCVPFPPSWVRGASGHSGRRRGKLRLAEKMHPNALDRGRLVQAHNTACCFQRLDAQRPTYHTQAKPAQRQSS